MAGARSGITRISDIENTIGSVRQAAIERDYVRPLVGPGTYQRASPKASVRTCTAERSLGRRLAQLWPSVPHGSAPRPCHKHIAA